MTPAPGPIHPHRPGGPSRVIQGFFPGGKPRIIQASPAPATPVRPPAPVPLQARAAFAPTPILPARPANGALQPSLRPGQPPRPILPTNGLQPRTLQPAASVRPQAPQPILPQRAAPTAVQPHAGDAFALPASFVLKPQGSGQPLPDPVQKKMEASFNTSFADVRVHIGQEASSIGALAFTHGTDLYFAPGQYNPQTTQGQQLLGHELTHVVQQRAGRVRNPLGSGVAVVQDPALEAEAERMGLRAASHQLTVQAKQTAPMRLAPPGARQPTQPQDALRLPTAGDRQGSVQRAAPVNVSGMMAVGNGSYQIVAGTGGQKVGSVKVHNRGESTIEVTDLAVDPSHRKQGIGGVLMASALRAGLQLGKTKVTLASQDSGTGRLTSWYRNMGFVPVGSNRLGYPVLEAHISRALSCVAQACMVPSRTSATAKFTAGARQPAPVVQLAEMTKQQAFDRATAIFTPEQFRDLNWPNFPKDEGALREYIQRHPGKLAGFKKDLQGTYPNYKAVSHQTEHAAIIKEKKEKEQEKAAAEKVCTQKFKAGHKVLTIRLIKLYIGAGYSVSTIKEYSETDKQKVWHYGVTISITPAGKQAGPGTSMYTHFHVHKDTKTNMICAHFKEQAAAVARQGYDLKIADNDETTFMTEMEETLKTDGWRQLTYG